jgi:hypothetical protein
VVGDPLIPPGYFWADDEEWRQANHSLRLLFQRYDRDLASVRHSARLVAEMIDRLEPAQNDMCARVCPDCGGVCCRRARVGYDFRDLVLIHALGIETPPHQLQTHQDSPCRYLGPGGCALPRLHRPFICTWYYCDRMLALFYQLPRREQNRLTESMKTAQTTRVEMEAAFIRVVTP